MTRDDKTSNDRAPMMNDEQRPDLSDPKVILALPKAEQFGYVDYPIDENGFAYLENGQVLRGLKGKIVRVPRLFERRKAFLSEPTDLLYAVDEDGVMWAPGKFESGWRRVRV